MINDNISYHSCHASITAAIVARGGGCIEIYIAIYAYSDSKMRNGKWKSIFEKFSLQR